MDILCIYNSKDLSSLMGLAVFILKMEEKFNLKSVIDFNVKNLDGEINMNNPNPTIYIKDFSNNKMIPNYLEPEKIVLFGVVLPKSKMIRLTNKFLGQFLWFDRYDDTNTFNLVNGLRDEEIGTCELVWHYYFKDKEVPEIIKLIGDYNYKYTSKQKEIYLLKYQYGIRSSVKNYKDAYNLLKASIDKKQTYGFEITEKSSLEDYLFKKGSIIYEYFLNCNIKQLSV